MAETTEAVYRGYTQAELDAQYSQATLVPDLTPYVSFWKDESERARRELDCRTDVAYGPSRAERLDIFPAARPGAPVHLNFHGGAWRLLSKEYAAFPALQLVPAGATYAAVDFALAAEVTLDEMVRQVRAATAWMYAHAGEYNGDPDRLFISGHSSGAHLCAMILADGWRAEAGLPETLVKGAVIASGAYDLEPVRLSARNEYLNLDEAAARRNSATRHIPANGPPILVGWGEGELDEFRRQGAEFAVAWEAAGNHATAEEFPGHNHFDMSNAFGDPDSRIVRAAIAQMGLA